MQQPGYNPSMPGMPMQNGFNAGPPNAGFGGPNPGFGGPNPGFGGPNPGFRPGFNQVGPCFGRPAPSPQMQQQGPGCFMPAATIRKISNTTPPAQFFNPPQ